MFPHELEKIHDFLDKHDWEEISGSRMENGFDLESKLCFARCRCKGCGKEKWRSFIRLDINKEWP